MNFARGSPMVAGVKAQDGPEGVWVVSGSLKLYPESGFTAQIPEQAGLCAILAHHKIQTAICIEITYSRAALFAIYFDAAFPAGHGVEMTLTVAFQKQT